MKSNKLDMKNINLVKIGKPTSTYFTKVHNSGLYKFIISESQTTMLYYATYRFVCCIFDVASKNDLLPDQHGLIVCTKFWIDERIAGTSDSIGHSD